MQKPQTLEQTCNKLKAYIKLGFEYETKKELEERVAKEWKRYAIQKRRQSK